jgi:SAM-dependent methyltransferase
MCSANVLEFFIEEAIENEFEGKTVLEIGSKYVNGSVRPLIEKFLRPGNYVGVDIESGKYVDVVLNVEDLTDHFGPDSFDVIIATELLEHINDWRIAIKNIKIVLKPAGHLYITTRSMGMPFHAYPYDFWRFDMDDIKNIFSDFEILSLVEDHEPPGVFLKCKKPSEWKPNSLEGIPLYSMILGKKTTDIPRIVDMPVLRKIKLAGCDFGRSILRLAKVVLKPGI